MNDIPLTSGIFYGWQRSSVIKSPLFLPVYYSDVLDVFNQNEHKERILLTGRDIEFSFKNSENGCTISLSTLNLASCSHHGRKRRW